jgi:hypothetical protein
MIDEDGDVYERCRNPHCEGYGCDNCRYRRGWVPTDRNVSHLAGLLHEDRRKQGVGWDVADVMAVVEGFFS